MPVNRLFHALSLPLLILVIFLALPGSARAADPIEIKVITYNIAGLPEAVTNGRGFPPIEKRFKYISYYLRDYDIIGLQEVFVGEREIIEKRLGHYFVAHGTDTLGVQRVGSGIYIFSRWPIPQSTFEQWRTSAGADALSHKGFVMVTTQLPGGPAVDVYSLHMQAGKENADLRRDQYAQLFAAMERLSFGQRRPILLMGDFNCKVDYDEAMARIAEKGFTHVSPGLPHVDHMFFNANGSGWRITPVSAKKVFTEDMPGGRPSDHEALEAVLRFERDE